MVVFCFCFFLFLVVFVCMFLLLLLFCVCVCLFICLFVCFVLFLVLICMGISVFVSATKDIPPLSCPRELTFTLWGCCGLCFWHKPAELAPTPFYSVLLSVSVFMAQSTVFHSINSPDNFSLSHLVFRSYLCLIGPFIYISLYENLLQPWCNSLWLTGLWAPTN